MNWNKYKIGFNEKIILSRKKTLQPIDRSEAKFLDKQFVNDTESIGNFQNKLYAENRQSLLIILQGMDSAGKDSAIKKIMQTVNPLGLIAWSFKQPSAQELEHDHLWRFTKKLPEHGQITIFNRSYYENVLVSKVHPEIVLAERLPEIDKKSDISKTFWKKRYEQINDFEKNIVENGTRILKFFLHLSKDEQRIRFLERIENKEKHWKFNSDDIAERKYWNDYQRAYEQAFRHTSTRHAPWYIIPADDKQYAHALMSRIILEQLKEMNPAFPPIDKQEKKRLKEAKEKLKNG